MSILGTSASYQTDAVRHFGKNGAVRYPSPFFDVASQYMPESQHRLNQWCAFYFYTNPLINVAVWKMAEYPVTELLFKNSSDAENKKWKKVYHALKIRSFEIEVGLDYFTYGNAFVSIYTPFLKTLQCSNCKRRTIASHKRSAWKWVNNAFWLQCPDCKHEGIPKAEDVPIRDPSGIRLVRWSPEQIDIQHNPTTGVSRYLYRIPMLLRSQVQQGNREVLETTPQVFLEATARNQTVLFAPNRIYHLRRPNIAGKDSGWGLPLIYPVLKDVFYMQIMQKAQETLLMEYVVPMRMVFPAQSASVNDPGGAYNMKGMIAAINREFRNFRIDPNYIMTFPINLGFQQWGGTGKALILHQEFRVHGDKILVGMGVPPGLVGDFAIAPQQQRVLGTSMSNYNAQRHEMIQSFIFGGIADFMGWEVPQTEYDPFRMADDLQQSMHMFQLAQANYIPRDYVLRFNGWDPAETRRKLAEENSADRKVNRDTQVAGAQVAAEVAAIQGRQAREDQKKLMFAQAEAQAQIQAMMPPPPPMPGAQPEATPVGGTDPMQPPQPELPPGSPQGIIPLGPGPQPAIPVALSGPEGQRQIPGMGGSAADVAGGVARASDGPGQQDNATARENQIAVNALPPQVRQAVALLRNDAGAKTNPLDALKNPQPDGSAPQADPGRRIG